MFTTQGDTPARRVEPKRSTKAEKIAWLADYFERRRLGDWWPSDDGIARAADAMVRAGLYSPATIRADIKFAIRKNLRAAARLAIARRP